MNKPTREEFERAFNEVLKIHPTRLAMLVDDTADGYFDITKTNLDIIRDCLILAYILQKCEKFEVKL